MALVLACRELWPTFVHHSEDQKLYDEKYRPFYGSLRPIFWDMTSLPMCQPSDAELQRLTYSSYYGMNCAKGAIGLQLCGWIVTWNLWTGCVSDTRYQEHSGIFQAQQKFAMADRIDGGVEDHLPFTNVFDKGYRNRLAAWRNGKQLTLQPEFAKSDSKFGRNKTLTSAKIAADRAANERAVRLAKMSGYVKRGVTERTVFERVDNAWLAWGFQVNFMYNDEVL